jgi:hypothetical protein
LGGNLGYIGTDFPCAAGSAARSARGGRNRTGCYGACYSGACHSPLGRSTCRGYSAQTSPTAIVQ